MICVWKCPNGHTLRLDACEVAEVGTPFCSECEQEDVEMECLGEEDVYILACVTSHGIDLSLYSSENLATRSAIQTVITWIDDVEENERTAIPRYWLIVEAINAGDHDKALKLYNDATGEYFLIEKPELDKFTFQDSELVIKKGDD